MITVSQLIWIYTIFKRVFKILEKSYKFILLIRSKFYIEIFHFFKKIIFYPVPDTWIILFPKTRSSSNCITGCIGVFYIRTILTCSLWQPKIRRLAHETLVNLKCNLFRKKDTMFRENYFFLLLKEPFLSKTYKIIFNMLPRS